MKAFLILFLLVSPLSATYVFRCEEAELTQEQKTRLFECILKGEPPRTFYDPDFHYLKAKCRRISSSLQLEWIPPSLWQLAVIHAFFNDPNIRIGILACGGQRWEPIEYEETLHHHLISADQIEDIIHCFDHHSRTLPNLCNLFFQVNKAVHTLYLRAEGSYLKMLHLAISELPPFTQWKEKQFPFWKSPWIYNPNSAEIFYTGLQDINLLTEIVKLECLAHENGEWVLYRGYPSSAPLSTLQFEDGNSHALSFGSTLLGGAFFSLDACAMTYSKPHQPTEQSFLALRVTPQELREFFRVGPLHPLIQMLVDGEMFHAHTKIATKNAQLNEHKTCEGYFMKCNKTCCDPIDYITNSTMTPEELERAFLFLCKKSGSIFCYPPKNGSF